MIDTQIPRKPCQTPYVILTDAILTRPRVAFVDVRFAEGAGETRRAQALEGADLGQVSALASVTAAIGVEVAVVDTAFATGAREAGGALTRVVGDAYAAVGALP